MQSIQNCHDKNLCGQRVKRERSLSKFLRLTVFSYLPLVSLIHKIALISKKEKENLTGSGIARSTETLNLKLRGVNQTFW